MTAKRKMIHRWSDNKDPLLKPFEHGFKREIVLRSDSASKRADVYYYSQKGNKLRSMPEVFTYLRKHTGMGLTEVNFTFCTCAIYSPPYEVVRQANPRNTVSADVMMKKTTGKQRQRKEAKEGYVDDSVLNYGDFGAFFKEQNVICAQLAVSVSRDLPLLDSQSLKDAPTGMENTDTRCTVFGGVTGERPGSSRDKKAPKLVSKDKGSRKRKLPGSMEATTSKAKSKQRSSSSQALRVAGESVPRKVQKEGQRSIVNYINVSQKKGKQRQAEEQDKYSTMTTVPQKVKQPEGEQRDGKTEAAKLDCGVNAGNMTLKPKGALSKPGGMTVGGWVDLPPFESQPRGIHSVSAESVHDGGQESGSVRELLQMKGQKKKLAQEKCRAGKLSRNKELNRHKGHGRKTSLQKERKASTETGLQSEKNEDNSSVTIKKKGQRKKREKIKERAREHVQFNNENVLKKEVSSIVTKQSKDYSSPLCPLQEGSLKRNLHKRRTLEDFGFAHSKEQEKMLSFVSDENDEENMKSSYILDKRASSVVNKKAVDQPVRIKRGVNKGINAVSKVTSGDEREARADPFVKPYLLPWESTPTEYSEVQGDVPQPITDTAKLHAISYVPSPKKDRTQLYRPDTEKRVPYNPGSQVYAAAVMSPSKTTVVCFEEEIKSFSDVKELNDKHIKYLFKKYMPEMQGIVEKKIYSWRNNDYHKGGKAKRMLTYKVYPSAFLDEQVSLISDMFIDEYVIRRKLTGDYLSQVLLPEFLIRVHMATNGTTHEESDRLMASTPVKLFNVPTHL
ncbi:uncharacterized protein LOC135396655 [Ornithodoros turicata]|uniref:uncharacterized protein LOC135396655 n=1 Tax=Ornithodoros turicata TaxID=34597 RepID=UPI003138D4E4